jgi:hypothetical protein
MTGSVVCEWCHGLIPLRKDGRLTVHLHWPAGHAVADRCPGSQCPPTKLEVRR